MLFEALAQPLRLTLAALDEWLIAAQARHLGKAHQHLVEEEAEPDALAPALVSNPVHAVVPVAGAHQRQAMLAEPQAVHDGAHAMVVEARRLLRLAGQIVVGVVLATDQTAVQEPGRLVEHPGVARGQDIAAGRQRQPEIVIRAAGADPATRGRMPPVLHVALEELAAGAAQQMLAHQGRLGMDERHRVLQLVAESEGAA